MSKKSSFDKLCFYDFHSIFLLDSLQCVKRQTFAFSHHFRPNGVSCCGTISLISHKVSPLKWWHGDSIPKTVVLFRWARMKDDEEGGEKAIFDISDRVKCLMILINIEKKSTISQPSFTSRLFCSIIYLIHPQLSAKNQLVLLFDTHLWNLL